MASFEEEEESLFVNSLLTLLRLASAFCFLLVLFVGAAAALDFFPALQPPVQRAERRVRQLWGQTEEEEENSEHG